MEATPGNTTPYDFANIGVVGFNLSQANDQPPLVFAGPALVRMGKIDQDTNTFRVRPYPS